MHVMAAEDHASLVAGIEQSVIWHNRDGSGRPTWFHPRACLIPGGKSAKALMTLQSISGSDVFGPVHWTMSSDLGRSWSEPQPIEGLGRRLISGQMEEGVCDVVPEYHAPTQTTLAIGHNVYYKAGRLANPQGPRHPVYTVRNAEGRWSTPQTLAWNDPRGTAIYTCGCSQRTVLPDGNLLIPLSFGPKDRKDRAVATALCKFDGQTITVIKLGNELRNAASRGLLEPSLAVLDGRHYLTIRAEDNHGHVAASDDGLSWNPAQPWAWDDGEPLVMSTTQQHWLVHSDALFLVYTRKDKLNQNVMRWRAPLYLARVDRKTLRLLRRTEQIAMPMIGDGINDPTHVPHFGNFHVTNASPYESWITVGDCVAADSWRGSLRLARIRWNTPNRLAPGA